MGRKNTLTRLTKSNTSRDVALPKSVQTVCGPDARRPRGQVALTEPRKPYVLSPGPAETHRQPRKHPVKTVGGRIHLRATWHLSPKPAPCPGRHPGHVPTATTATQQVLGGPAMAWALGDIRGPKVGGKHKAAFFCRRHDCSRGKPDDQARTLRRAETELLAHRHTEAAPGAAPSSQTPGEGRR